GGVLARLAAEGDLIEVLAALPFPRAAALAQLFDVFPVRAEIRRAGPSDDPIRTWIEEFARGLPAALSGPALLLALYVQARVHLGPAASEEAVRAAVASTSLVRQHLYRDTDAAPVWKAPASPALPIGARTVPRSPEVVRGEG